ncbi:hypothetical protein Tco_0740537 [Tanacetum coccineum]
MFIDHMHQLWRTLETIINKRISWKTTSNDRLRQSRVALIWGMFHKKRNDNDDIKQSEIYRMSLNTPLASIPPKKTRVSDESDSKPARKQTGSRRVIKKKVSISAEDNIIPEPNVTLKLGKSMSLTEATKEEATRQVYGTHERIVTESDPEPARRRRSANKKSSRSQSHVGGSSEGTVTKPGVLDESPFILTTSHEGTSIKPEVPDEVDWLYFDDDEEKKDDADDDKSIDLKVIDNEETNDEFVHGDEYVQENMDEEMKDAEVDDTGNGDEEITDTTKAYTEKTEEVKDDNNIKLQLIFGNFKDTTDAEINSSLDVQIQQEIPYIQSSSILNVHVLVISKSAVLSPIPKIPTVTLTTTPPPPHYVSAISHVLYEVYFSFGRHLDELHVTWAYLEKKRTRLRTYTNITQDNVISTWRRHHHYTVTPSLRRPRRRHMIP